MAPGQVSLFGIFISTCLAVGSSQRPWVRLTASLLKEPNVIGSLRQQLEDDLKSAMKRGYGRARHHSLQLASDQKCGNRQERFVDNLRGAALMQRETKRRVDSIEQFRTAGRDDLVEREEASAIRAQSTCRSN